MGDTRGSKPAGQTQLLELTSVRAFAALVVVLFHMFQSDTTPASGLLRRLVLDGHLGVDFFFILSGFILTHVYLVQWKSGTFKYGRFLWARFARVYPLHLFMILLFLVAYSAASAVGRNDLDGMRWDHLPWHVLLLHSWGFADGHSWNFPSWSVSAEAFAYLIFPACLFSLPLTRPRWSAALSILGLTAAWFILSANGWTLTKLMFNFGIVRILFEFTVGVSIYLIYEKLELRGGIASTIAAVAFLLVLLVASRQGPEIISVLLFAIIILMLAIRSRSPRKSLLRSRLLVYLGEISYSTYMAHLLVLMTMRLVFDRITPGLEWGGLLGLIFTILLIYLGSIVLYHGVELPARSFLRGLPGKRLRNDCRSG